MVSRRSLWSSSSRKHLTPGRLPRLEALEDRAVPAIITVTSTADTIALDGVITLREALTAANSNMPSGDAPAGDIGMDIINFNIAGTPGSVFTIQPTSALPTIIEPVFIDGFSQFGASPNTLTDGDNAFLAIELDGTLAGFHAGLTLSGGDSTVQGLVINNFKNEGILVLNYGGNTIRGNFIGTDQTGTTDQGNGLSGVSLLSANNTVGGTDPGARNLISGNDFSGVAILGTGATNNVIQGNYIGTDATGTAPLGNTGAGVRILDVSGNMIGGTDPGAGNVIAFNSGKGIQVANTAGFGNTFLGNSIFGNSDIGIDINNDGPTANDAFDGDNGPNGLQNFPVLTTAITGSEGTTIEGTLHSTPSSVFRIELFSNNTPDSSGFGTGQQFLGFVFATTDADGIASFSVSFSDPVAVGSVVTATATDLRSSTSEFSPGIVVTQMETPSTPAGNIPVPPPQRPVSKSIFAVGSGPGAATTVFVYNGDGSRRLGLAPYGGYAGGVTVAAGDVDGDGFADIVTGAGAGAPGGHVKVFGGTTGQEIRSFFAFPGYFGGVVVASGDVNGDGYADLIVGAAGGSANGHVKVFDGLTSQEIYSFFSFPGYTGSLVVAASDVDGDGLADIVVGAAGVEAGGHVKVFSGADGSQVSSFLTFPGTGISIAAGDVNGDGKAEIIVGQGTGGLVATYSGKGDSLLNTFVPYLGGAPALRVAAGDINGDGRADIITGGGPGLMTTVKVFDGATLTPLDSFFAFGMFNGGVFVGGTG